MSTPGGGNSISKDSNNLEESEPEVDNFFIGTNNDSDPSQFSSKNINKSKTSSKVSGPEPSVGSKSSLNSEDVIRAFLENSDMSLEQCVN